MIFNFSSILLVLFFFTGCIGSSKLIPEKSYRNGFEPVSHQVTFIESSSTDEVLLDSTGIGISLKGAILDSKLASLWFVLEGGKTRLLDSVQNRKAFKKISKDIYKNFDKYITYVSSIKSKRKEIGIYYVRKNYKINIRILKDDLILKGVIQDLDSISENVNFPIISVIPRNGKIGDKFEFVSDTVLSYLSENSFEAEVLTKETSVDKTISKSIALSGDIDPLYILAVNSGSDIYISVNPTVVTTYKYQKRFKKASVSLKAFYTVSKKLLASSTGHSQEVDTSSDNLLLEEATNSAVNEILSQIKRKWQKESKKGKYFRVILKTKFSNASNGVYSLLRKNCRKVSRKAGETIFDFTAQCKVRDSIELLKIITDEYQGEGKVFREFDTNSLLVIKIGNSEDDDFEIE